MDAYPDAAETTSTRPLRDDRHYDLVVIGSGAGGASLARRLADTGKSILIIERGGRLPHEQDNWNPRRVFIERKYLTSEHWYDKKGRRFRPNIHYWLGGNTSFYGAALFRFRKDDFDEVTHEDGLSPAWPISYTDLASYYTEAEHEWCVHGTRHDPTGRDPTDDPDAPDYPFPPIAHDEEVAILKRRLREIGWNAFDLPLGVDRNDRQPWRGRCVRCDTCGGFPCMVSGKSDARKVLDKIEQDENITILTGAKVDRLETSADGRTVTDIVCDTSYGELRFRGDLVVLAAGAINSALILLRSAGGLHPNGLANSSDQVGRNYMFHISSAVVSITRSKYEGTFPKTFAINDFYWRDAEGGYDYPMGHIQLLEHMNGDVVQGQLQDKIPEWLIPDGLANFLADRMLSFLVMSEDLPEQRNRIRLDNRGRIFLEYWPNNLSGHERLVKKFQKRLTRLGRLHKSFRQHRLQIDDRLPLYGTAHQCGTLRMGVDPASSVVDPSCKAHDLDNLYVADSGVFVSSAAVNPALTVVANAMRVGDVIRDRL